MASVIFCVLRTESIRLRSSRRLHRTTKPLVREFGVLDCRRVDVLASADEDQAVERWEHDMAAAPRRRGSPAAAAAGEEEVEGKGGKWDWMDWIRVER
jgi:hypothetical protein